MQLYSIYQPRAENILLVHRLHKNMRLGFGSLVIAFIIFQERISRKGSSDSFYYFPGTYFKER